MVLTPVQLTDGALHTSPFMMERIVVSRLEILMSSPSDNHDAQFTPSGNVMVASKVLGSRRGTATSWL